MESLCDECRLRTAGLETRNDEKVVNMEKMNVQYIDIDSVGRDLDFIQYSCILHITEAGLSCSIPVAFGRRMPGVPCQTEFEAGRNQVGKKGIVRDPADHREVIKNMMAYIMENGLYSHGMTLSPVTGTKGNIEYLLYMRKALYDGMMNVEKQLDTPMRS
ncbi:MAG: SAM-dependent methyltransferase [Anaerovoracaceae bacterium]